MAGLGDMFGASLATVNGGKPRNSDRIQTGQPLNLRGAFEAATNIPVVGDALSGGMAMYDAAKGDYGSAAMNALGVLPFVSAAPLAMMGMVNKAAKAKGVTTNAGNLAQAMPNQAGAIVWHGSPHKFDKFDMSKIGTGEGAQAYGHGLYFAENPGVAKDYLNTLSDDIVRLKDGREIKANIGSSPEKTAINALSRFPKSEGYSFDESYKYAKGGIRGAFRDSPGEMNPVLSILDEWMSMGGIPAKDGALYKSDIPDEAVARFLDWDNPLNEETRSQVSKALMDKFGSGVSVGSGEQAYKQILDEFKFAGSKDPKNEAIAWMNQQGIPGIRYLDGVSRSAGEGSSNFVLFDDKMPRILEINGQATGATPWRPGEYQSAMANAFAIK